MGWGNGSRDIFTSFLGRSSRLMRSVICCAVTVDKVMFDDDGDDEAVPVVVGIHEKYPWSASGVNSVSPVFRSSSLNCAFTVSTFCEPRDRLSKSAASP